MASRNPGIGPGVQNRLVRPRPKVAFVMALLVAMKQIGFANSLILSSSSGSWNGVSLDAQSWFIPVADLQVCSEVFATTSAAWPPMGPI